MSVVAAPGETNSMAISVAFDVQGFFFTVVDSGAALTAGSGCDQLTPSAVTCVASAARLDAGDLADAVTFTQTGFSGFRCDVLISGGSGNDTLSGYRLQGGDGNDKLNGVDCLAFSFEGALDGGAGDDVLNGSASAEFLVGGPGADQINGGAGKDVADFSDHTGAIFVDLDGVAGDDGSAGEGDTVAIDIELVRGGSGNDVLIGNGEGNRLEGGAGSDILEGGQGSDELAGGANGDVYLFGPTVAAEVDVLDEPLFSPEPNVLDFSALGPADPVSVDLFPLSSGVYATHSNRIVRWPSGSNGLETATVIGGRGDDRIQGAGLPNLLFGGPGNDTLIGNAPINPFSGDDDVLVGGAGDDSLEAGPGDDLLDGGLGADVLVGSTGAGAPDESDVADYSAHGAAVVVNLTDSGRDGGVEDAAGDTLSGIEDVWGGAGNDVLTGDGGSNSLAGGPGADVLTGLGGFDYVDYSDYTAAVAVDLDGAPGDDGAAGEGDTVAADVEAVFGGAGNDVLVGNAAANYLEGAAGADAIDTRDATKDEVNCGADADSVTADGLDMLTGCEAVSLPPLIPPVTSAPAPSPPAVIVPAVLASASSPRVTRSGKLAVDVKCSPLAQDYCVGKVSLSATVSPRLLAAGKPTPVTVALGARAFTVEAGKRKMIEVTLTRKGARLLAVVKPLKAKLTITARDATGTTRKVSKTVTLTTAPQNGRGRPPPPSALGHPLTKVAP